MDPQTQAFISAWKDVVARRDAAELASLFAEDATFRSPAVFKPYQGRHAVVYLLSQVMELFGDLAYTTVYANDQRGVVLLFETTVPGPEKPLFVQGVDIFQLDENGLIREMIVMIRPLRALQGIAAAMESRLAE